MKIRIQSVLITILILGFKLSPNAHAVTPAPDGGYPGANTAEGDGALLSLADGSYNTGIGFLSLSANTRGNFNTATGAGALLSNILGSENTATGAGTLLNNAMAFVGGGNGNTGNGAFALFYNTTGSLNTAIGDRALFNNSTGSNNIALGVNAGSMVTTATNVITIGAAGSNVNNSCYIGSIFGATSFNGVGVFVSPNGRLGTRTSSRRFKDEIKSMDQASEALFALKPVVFRYKKEIDPAGTPQFGLVAEDVEEVNPELVVRDKEGKPYTVRYDQINAMLLNEFLKEHRKIEKQNSKLESQARKIQEQDTAIAELKSGMKGLAAMVNEQGSRLREVSAQLQINDAAARVIVSNH